MNALHLKLAKKNREVDTSSWERLYSSLTVRKIRKNIAPSVNEENAILRKTVTKVIDMLVAKTDISKEQALEIFAEFYNYNAAVEQCKTEAKTEME